MFKKLIFPMVGLFLCSLGCVAMELSDKKDSQNRKRRVHQRGSDRLIKSLNTGDVRPKKRVALATIAGCAQDGSKYLKEVEKRIKEGDDVNEKNSHGKTPLLSAIECSFMDCFYLLLEAGSDVNISDDQGFSPLDYALLSGNEEIYEILVQKGAKHSKKKK